MLWRSNGTPAGTIKLCDAAPQLYGFTSDNLFFSANENLHGTELWKSDGSVNGTSLLKDIKAGTAGSYPDDFCNVNNIIYLSATDAAHGEELWKSDGTTSGTLLVKDIVAGPNSSFFNSLSAAAGKLFFQVQEVYGARMAHLPELHYLMTH